MLNYKSFFAITLATLFSIASSAPAKPGADVSGTLELCTGAEVGVDCFDLPLSGSDSSSNSCLAFTTTGALSHFYQSITGVVVPTGFFCMFFQSSTCTSCTQNSGAFIPAGSWDMSAVPGVSGLVDFTKLTVSLSCVLDTN
ncbi:hypothetical protein GGX14DRAFT_165022 [Mycena pura]|uniref:Uncharacterized protein n=1 Tax=Mycena pura TaxID=153505 RepID=A0AAD7E1G8_9AGAR|nr:hypothetical protein GGX14DRAFT_165022 [Mycena pura]